MISRVRTRLAVIASLTGLMCAAVPTFAQDKVEPSVSNTASAVQAASTMDTATPQAPASEIPAVAGAIVAKVRRFLANGKYAGKAAAVSTAAALVKFYSEAGRSPLWVDDNGLTVKAKELLMELANAETYGLDGKAYAVQGIDADLSSLDVRALVEIRISTATLDYARHAQGGRLTRVAAGAQLTHTPVVSESKKILGDLAQQSDPAFYLRSLHPPHPQFAQLREKLKVARGGSNQDAGPKIPDGPVLKPGVSHAHVKLLRQRLGLLKDGDEMPRETAEKFDDDVKKLVLAFQKKNALAEDGVVGAGTRKVLNGQSPERIIAKVLINMERWRWLPDNLGKAAGIYVWTNIPELRTRVVKAGKTVFSERAIVGQVGNKTPVFSDRIEWIEMHPTWFVPASIKIADILPSLRRPTSSVMERYNLRVDCGALGSNYKTIDWKTVDVSKCHFTQPPGKLSVLGDFKFKFPNKYSVYLHDTHDRSLFRHTRRTFSHGCVRVQQPRRMAEILLDHDKGITSAAIGKILAGPKVLHKKTLNKPVPVHMTYFTATFDEDGRLKLHPDYYGYDGRIALALTGKAFAEPHAPKANRKPRKPKSATKKKSNWVENLLQSN